MTSYFPGDYYEVVWCNKGWATNFICTEMQNMPELWVPGVTNWCFPALFNFSVCYFCLSLESLPSTADLVSLSSSNLFISLIPLLNLTLKPLDYPLSWMLHGAALALVFWATSGTCSGSLSPEPAPPPAAFWGFICYFQFRKLFSSLISSLQSK